MTADDRARVFVQWKGTNVCLDFWCACGAQIHHDGEFAYHLVCPYCSASWDMPCDFHLRRSTGQNVQQPDTGYDAGSGRAPHSCPDDGSIAYLKDDEA